MTTATTKKPAARKTVAPKATKEIVEATESTEVEIEAQAETKPVAKPVARKLEDDTPIEIMNNTTGRYGYLGKSGYSMDMDSYGDTLTIPFGELKKMKSSQKRHIEEAFIVILDEDAVKALQYEKLYENVLDTEAMESILVDFEKLSGLIDKMPKMMRETLGTIATRKFRSGELYDLRVKRLIQDNLKIQIDV